MRKIARKGGLKSGKTRQKLSELRGRMKSPDRELVTAAALKADSPNHSGGSHDTDWRCPQCRHNNTIKRRMCAKCKYSPANGRLTRKALKVRAEEHRVQATLRKFAIPECGEGDIPYMPAADPRISQSLS